MPQPKEASRLLRQALQHAAEQLGQALEAKALPNALSRLLIYRWFLRRPASAIEIVAIAHCCARDIGREVA